MDNLGHIIPPVTTRGKLTIDNWTISHALRHPWAITWPAFGRLHFRGQFAASRAVNRPTFRGRRFRDDFAARMCDVARAMKWIRQHNAEIVITALALAVGAGVFAYAHRDRGALEESKQRGTAIVEALQQYRGAHGTYPATLETLIPSYIATIEPPTWGLRRWRYRRYTVAHDTHTAATDTGVVYFQLSVAANDRGYPVLYYDFALRRWVLNN